MQMTVAMAVMRPAASPAWMMAVLLVLPLDTELDMAMEEREVEAVVEAQEQAELEAAEEARLLAAEMRERRIAALCAQLRAGEGRDNSGLWLRPRCAALAFPQSKAM